MRRDLKWYCAINAETLDCDGYEWRDLIRVGIISALRNTHLRPHLIYDGPEDDFLGEIRQLGATVIRQKTSLYTALHERYHDRPQWLAAVSGAFLRFEIPQIEMTDQFVLYTDSDVLFLRDPQFGDTDPAIFGATSQFSHNPAEDMNSASC